MGIIKISKEKWRRVQIEKKIIISWIISLIVVLTLSSILYLSKKELHYSSDAINRNSELRLTTQNLISSIHLLEISSKRYILTGSPNDSIKYFSILDSLQNKLSKLERLTKNQPRFYNHFLRFQSLVKNDLFNFDHLSVSLKNEQIINSKIIKLEENIYKKLDEYLQLLDEEEEQAAFDNIQLLHSKINANLNHFFILIITYISLLTILFIVIISDVKKRRKLAAEVVQNKEELNTIINTAPALIFVKDKNKKFELVNTQFLKFFNTSLDNVLLKDNSEIVSLNDKWLADEEDMEILERKLTISNIERSIMLPGGETVWLQINKAPLYDKDNNVVGIVGVMGDITDRVQFQEGLVAAHKELELLNKQKDKFFSIIAHDLRGPFTGMLGLTEILITDFNYFPEEERKIYISEIHNSLKSLLTLIDNLLTWAKLNQNRVSINTKEVDFINIIQSVFQSQKIAARNKKISLNYNCANDVKIIADEDMIATVIRNLVANAIKFTNPEGQISVSVLDQKEFLKVEIEDNGVGMTSEIANNLFKSDVLNNTTRGTNDEKGTGLGLIICKEFIEKHKGNISVKSEVGKGTTISFVLPKKINNPELFP